MTLLMKMWYSKALRTEKHERIETVENFRGYTPDYKNSIFRLTFYVHNDLQPFLQIYHIQNKLADKTSNICLSTKTDNVVGLELWSSLFFFLFVC